MPGSNLHLTYEHATGRVLAEAQLATARGHWLQLYVEELDTTQLVVRDADGRSGTFDYLVHGVRRGAKQHEVIRPRSEAR